MCPDFACDRGKKGGTLVACEGQLTQPGDVTSLRRLFARGWGFERNGDVTRLIRSLSFQRARETRDRKCELVDTVSIAVYAAHHETDDTASSYGSLCGILRRAIGWCQDPCARKGRRRSKGAASARIASHAHSRVHPESNSREQRLETPRAWHRRH